MSRSAYSSPPPEYFNAHVDDLISLQVYHICHRGSQRHTHTQKKMSTYIHAERQREVKKKNGEEWGMSVEKKKSDAGSKKGACLP